MNVSSTNIQSKNLSSRRLVSNCWTAVAVLSTVVGCNSSSEPALESLPWNDATQGSPASATLTPTAAPSSASAARDPRELEFRDGVVKSCLDDLRHLAAEPLAVESVGEANRNNWQTQAQIEQIDQQWRQTKGVDDPLVQKYLNNPCADMLRDAQRKHPEYAELFLMDNKGCLVAESNKTSDYWQGDEDKWIKSFNGGRGTVFVDEVKFDQSSRSFVVQISLPVFDQHGETIGAMTASVVSDRQN